MAIRKESRKRNKKGLNIRVTDEKGRALERAGEPLTSRQKENIKKAKKERTGFKDFAAERRGIKPRTREEANDLKLNERRFDIRKVDEKGNIGELQEQGQVEERVFNRVSEISGEEEKQREDLIRTVQETPEALAGATPEEVEGKSRLREIMENPATPIALAVGIAGLLTGGAALGVFGAGAGAGAAAGGVAARAGITAGAKRVLGVAGKTAVSKAAKIGKPAVLKAAKVAGAKGKLTASRFATNTKTTRLTKNFFVKLGLTVGGASLLKDAVGTYPFAGFIKEEASQVTGMAFKKAMDNKDTVGMRAALQEQEEILGRGGGIVDKIPYVNVQSQLKEYFEAVAEDVKINKRILEKRERGERQ